jgi:hypothetical protein
MSLPLREHFAPAESRREDLETTVARQSDLSVATGFRQVLRRTCREQYLQSEFQLAASRNLIRVGRSHCGSGKYLRLRFYIAG